MALTMEQALNAQEFHAPGVRPCNDKNGPIRWRRNGQTKTWKREPERFSIPVKHGLYSYDRIENADADNVHTLEDCPVVGLAMVCQDCFADIRPTEYWPDQPTDYGHYVNCANCGNEVIFVARVRREELTIHA